MAVRVSVMIKILFIIRKNERLPPVFRVGVTKKKGARADTLLR